MSVRPRADAIALLRSVYVGSPRFAGQCRTSIVHLTYGIWIAEAKTHDSASCFNLPLRTGAECKHYLCDVSLREPSTSPNPAGSEREAGNERAVGSRSRLTAHISSADMLCAFIFYSYASSPLGDVPTWVEMCGRARWDELLRSVLSRGCGTFSAGRETDKASF